MERCYHWFASKGGWMIKQAISGIQSHKLVTITLRYNYTPIIMNRMIRTQSFTGGPKNPSRAKFIHSNPVAHQRTQQWNTSYLTRVVKLSATWKSAISLWSEWNAKIPHHTISIESGDWWQSRVNCYRMAHSTLGPVLNPVQHSTLKTHAHTQYNSSAFQQQLGPSLARMYVYVCWLICQAREPLKSRASHDIWSTVRYGGCWCVRTIDW